MQVIGIPRRNPRELNQGGTGTSETVFTSDGTLPVILDLPSAGALADTNANTVAFFGVRAWGRVTGGTTTNYTVALQAGTSATAGDNTDIEQSTAIAVNSNSGQWFIEARLIWDTTSNTYDGFSRFGVWGSTRTFTDWAAIDNSISADPDGNVALGFVVTGTFSSGHASNVSVLGGFELLGV